MVAVKWRIRRSTRTKILVDLIIGVEQTLQSLMLLLVVLFEFPDLSSIKSLDRFWRLYRLPLLLQGRFIVAEVDAQTYSIALLFCFDGM